jgi:hypothetical protein
MADPWVTAEVQSAPGTRPTSFLSRFRREMTSARYAGRAPAAVSALLDVRPSQADTDSGKEQLVSHELATARSQRGEPREAWNDGPVWLDLVSGVPGAPARAADADLAAIAEEFQISMPSPGGGKTP